MRQTVVAAIAAAAIVTWGGLHHAAPADAKHAPALAARYTDELSGFSLCPPLGAERLRETSRRRLVCWVRRDDKAAAVRWSLEVLRTRQEPSKLPLDQYAKAVAKELAKTGFKVQSTQVGTVAGKPAMHFRGPSTGRLERWTRQTWVQTDPSQHLVLSIAGVVTDRDEMDAVLTAVAGSLKLFDPAAALARLREALARGADALGKLNQAKLKALLAGEPYYLTLQLKDKTIGFLKVTETMDRRWNASGLWVVRLGALRLPGQPRRLTREELFATADRKFERWRRIVVEGEGPTATKSVSEAIKQKEVVVLQTTQPGRPRSTRRRKLPETVRSSYLPQAFDVLAGRLMGLAAAGTYGFAMYNAAGNYIDLRTLRVIGGETISLAGRRVKATHLRDQMAQDAPPADVWVDENCMLLRMRTAEGLIVERSRQRAVAARFAGELRELEKLGSKDVPRRRPD